MTRDGETASEKLATVAHDVRDKAASVAHDVRDKASSLTTAARERGSDLAAGARDSAGRAVNSTSDLIRDHPIAATALALSAGALIGIMLPRARIGIAATSAARKTARMVAAAETVKTLAALLATASEKVRAGASDLSERVPDLKDIREAAAHGVAKAGDAVGSTGRQVAEGARKVGQRLTGD